MYLSGKPSTFETGPVPTQRAGLRVPPAAGQPTGIFEVIEMAVLVIVTALAMVSIIVAGSEDDGRPHAEPSTVGVPKRQDVREPVHRDRVAPMDPAARTGGRAVDVAVR